MEEQIRRTLRTNHLLDVPLRYVVFVEGETDVSYINTAARLVVERFGVDPLRADENHQIVVAAPANPAIKGRRRGGTPQLRWLGDDLKHFAVQYGMVGPICFVLDHDAEGVKTAKELEEMGYKSDRARAITIDHQYHPRACRQKRKGDDPIVVEDLISLALQHRFFQTAAVSCDIAYIEGEASRIVWRHPSKDALCEYVQTNARMEDLVELVRVLCRVRELWQLGIPEELHALLAMSLE